MIKKLSLSASSISKTYGSKKVIPPKKKKKKKNKKK